MMKRMHDNDEDSEGVGRGEWSGVGRVVNWTGGGVVGLWVSQLHPFQNINPVGTTDTWTRT